MPAAVTFSGWLLCDFLSFSSPSRFYEMSLALGCSVRVKMRFSTKRFKEFVDKLTPDQREFVDNSTFGVLLNFSKFKVPVPLLEWIMSHVDVACSEFKYKDKSFKITNSMVQRVLGIPSGTERLNFDTVPDDIATEVSNVRPDYFNGQLKPPIERAISLCLAEHNEEAFIRSFLLVALATVLCPNTQNSIEMKYLNFLMRPSEIRNYDWCSHILEYVLSEVKKFQSAISSSNRKKRVDPYFYGSCLPLLVVLYMDFLQLNDDSAPAHEISYNVPRFCHVSTNDFLHVANIDRDRSSRARFLCFGALPVHIPCFVNNQWVLVVINFMEKRFDVLDPHPNTQTSVPAVHSEIYIFKSFFKMGYTNSVSYNMNEFNINNINVPKCNVRCDSGIFVIQYMQTFNGREVQPFSNADVTALRAKFLFQLTTSKYNKANSPFIQNFIQNHVVGFPI